MVRLPPPDEGAGPQAVADVAAAIGEEHVEARRLQALQHFVERSGILGPKQGPAMRPHARRARRESTLARALRLSRDHWDQCRTGNVLFRHGVLPAGEPPFREEYGTGVEDKDFFRRLAAAGHSFVWCNEAVVSESVPASRLTRIHAATGLAARQEQPPADGQHPGVSDQVNCSS
jgi:hypothetical protein